MAVIILNKFDMKGIAMHREGKRCAMCHRCIKENTKGDYGPVCAKKMARRTA